MATLSLGPAKFWIWLAVTTTLALPEEALKSLTVRATLPDWSAVTVRAAAIPARLPVLVPALELTLTALLPSPPSTVVGLAKERRLAVSAPSPRLSESAEPGEPP